MVYKYIIDNGESGEDLVTNNIYSEIKFSPKEFKKIVEDAYKAIGENEYDVDYFGFGVTITDYLVKYDDRFFSIPAECIVEVQEFMCSGEPDENGVYINLYRGCDC